MVLRFVPDRLIDPDIRGSVQITGPKRDQVIRSHPGDALQSNHVCNDRRQKSKGCDYVGIRHWPHRIGFARI
jgi:hypothetical protein